MGREKSNSDAGSNVRILVMTWRRYCRTQRRAGRVCRGQFQNFPKSDGPRTGDKKKGNEMQLGSREERVSECGDRQRSKSTLVKQPIATTPRHENMYEGAFQVLLPALGVPMDLLTIAATVA